uniref:Uncharacterized protein n=1 Tax=Glossina pallidipes TaxID=7398 RepID=A0A1A9ZLN1_GLOPL
MLSIISSIFGISVSGRKSLSEFCYNQHIYYLNLEHQEELMETSLWNSVPFASSFCLLWLLWLPYVVSLHSEITFWLGWLVGWFLFFFRAHVNKNLVDVKWLMKKQKGPNLMWFASNGGYNDTTD